jgi:hypothetical protein
MCDKPHAMLMGAPRTRLYRTISARAGALLMALFPFSGACKDASEAEALDTSAPLAHVDPGFTGPDPLVQLLRGEAQRQRMCAHDGDDMLRSLFCGDEPAKIESLVDLQKALYIDQPRLTGVNGLSIAGHSTSLGARSISSINPRVVAVRIEHPLFDAHDNPVAPGSQGRLKPELEPVSIAYSRGEQLVELMVRDRVDHELRFYLMAFRQACNDSEAGCKPGDLLTPEIETSWTETTLYDEQDLTNTVLDCAPCHQSNGPGTPKFLRMQELRTPWTHWFGLTEGGEALFADYLAARGEETMFGLDADHLGRANPVNLNLLAVYGGPNDQPNGFDSQTIEDEVRASAAGQPGDNSVPGQSETWLAGYEAARRGESITFPYHDVKVTDPDKLAHMTEVYAAYRAGDLDRADLPDIRDVLPDDQTRLSEMGLATKPGATGEEVLLEACSMCHNERLDQSLSRARFRADLRGLTRAERARAIERLQLPATDLHGMPPARLRVLTAEARQRAIDALKR